MRTATLSIASVCLCLLGCGSAGPPTSDEDFGELSPPDAPVVADEEAGPGEDEPAGDAADPPAVKKGDVFTKNDRGLVDMQAALEANPRLVKTVNTSTSGNYLSAVKDSGFAGVSKLQTGYLDYDRRAFEAEHGRKPTFEEMKARWEQSGNQLKGLKPYQMYAYDAESGEIAILEDPDEKAKILGR